MVLDCHQLRRRTGEVAGTEYPFPMKSYRDMVAEAKSVITEVSPAEAWRRAGSGAVLVDIREPVEHADGTAPGALLIPRGLLESELGRHVDDPETEILLYCAGGSRSALAARSLEAMGYTRVRSVEGGFGDWKTAGLPWGPPDGLTEVQRGRYQRHLTLTEVGEEGQQRLLDATVLLVGAGGLGSPAGLYLAAAGVGTIVLVDDDVVDASNLQRQVLHTTDRIGRSKVESAKTAMTALNPDVTVAAHRTRLDAGNILDLMAGVDVVIDGADNFPTRYLVNDASLHARVPVVHGSVFRFDGQVSVFQPYDGPCYRCLYPEPPPPELAPNCAEAGVLGVLPGVVGTLQAVEALKLILGIGDSLAGRLLTYDALDQNFLTLRVAQDPECPACGDENAPPRLIDYDASCRAEKALGTQS